MIIERFKLFIQILNYRINGLFKPWSLNYSNGESNQSAILRTESTTKSTDVLFLSIYVVKVRHNETKILACHYWDFLLAYN